MGPPFVSGTLHSKGSNLPDFLYNLCRLRFPPQWASSDVAAGALQAWLIQGAPRKLWKKVRASLHDVGSGKRIKLQSKLSCHVALQLALKQLLSKHLVALHHGCQTPWLSMCKWSRFCWHIVFMPQNYSLESQNSSRVSPSRFVNHEPCDTLSKRSLSLLADSFFECQHQIQMH